jgi:hypothetical protein
LPGLIEHNAKTITDLLPTFAEPICEAHAADAESIPKIGGLYASKRCAAGSFQSLPGMLRQVCAEVLEEITSHE